MPVRAASSALVAGPCPARSLNRPRRSPRTARRVAMVALESPSTLPTKTSIFSWSSAGVRAVVVMASPSTPALGVVEVDSEGELAHELVDEHLVGGMDAPEAAVAEESFEAVAGEDARSPGKVEGEIDHPERLGDGGVLGGDDLHRPVH